MSFKDEEIDEVLKKETSLPATHRHGRGGSRDDVATDNNGRPTKVPTPETPDDRFS
jgi:hypothetical protein